MSYFTSVNRPTLTPQRTEGRTDTTTNRVDSLLKKILLLHMLNFKIKLILIELAQHKLLKQDSDEKKNIKKITTAKINKFCLLKVAKLE